VRAAVLTAVFVVVALYLFTQFVRRSSMFFPARFPEGVWDTASLPVQPEDVPFRSDDGTALHGWLFRARDMTQPLIVWFHGNAGNVTDRAPMAAELARRGVSTFVFDWRGYGKSAGVPAEDALFRDALAAYDVARSKTSGDIVIYGESLGGPYAAYTATKRKARAVIIENSFPSLGAMGNALYRPLPLGWFAPFALTTTKWLNEAGFPVLVMHGKRDAVIPFALGKELYDDLTVPKEMIVSESSGHCEFATSEPERYYSTVVRFVTGK
jgi:fermentation-respiration switch protein FrsA (DUF1100 family)